MKLRSLRNIVTTGLGIIMVLSPLALWIAWSRENVLRYSANVRAVILHFVAD